MTDKNRIVIVGAGMAGGKLVEELAALEALSALDVTIIGEEPGGNYDRIRLTERFDTEADDRFWLNDETWFRTMGIRTHLNERVERIDPETQKVATNRGTAIPYDTLVLAVGALPLIPEIDGVETPGVFTLRNLGDVDAIGEWIDSRPEVTVMGGGLLGLELADRLLALGKTVTLSHLFDTLMEQQLDPTSARVLEARFRAKGLRIEKMNPIVKVAQETTRLVVTRKDGSVALTDAVIINCGIVPDTRLAAAAGIPTKRGIVVDETLRTGVSDIYAIGECIEFEHQRFGLLAPVYAQARVLAKRLAGEPSVYRNTPLPVVKLKSDVPAVAMGIIAPAEGDTVITYDNPIDLIRKELIVRDQVLVGARLVGDDLNADALGGYYASKIPLPKRIEALLFPGVKLPGTESQAVYWPLDVSVCDCNGISAHKVRDAVKRYGRDVKTVTLKTGAALNCGTCQSRVEAIVESSFDAVVVGAGLGGLTAAAKLAKSGRRVRVIERHDQVGGYATSFTREGYTFDVSLHNLGPMNNSIAKIFENLGLDKRVEYIPFDHFIKIVFPEHTMVIPKGFGNFIEMLKTAFDTPEAKAGLTALAEEIWTIRKGFEEIELLTLDAPATASVSPMMAVKYPQFAELIFTTFGELLDKYVSDEKLKGLISNAWWYLGLPPSEMASILYAVVAAGYVEYGGGCVRGTSQTLSNALRDIIEEAGGVVQLNTEVTRILSDGGKVEGVITDSGEIFYTNTVISNAGAVNTFTKLVEDATLKKKYTKKVTRQENSLSAIQLYLGLDCPLSEIGGDKHGHGFSVFPSYDHDENYRAIVEGDHERTPFSCMLYSNQDDTLAPKGCSVLNILSLDHIKNWESLPERQYLKKKAAVIDTLLTRVEPYLPGIESHVVVKELGTPKTMIRYTANPEGAIFGPSQNVYQSGLNRLQPETPIEGLFLVGSSIYPGGGYPSVINSGYRTAHLIIEKAEER